MRWFKGIAGMVVLALASGLVWLVVVALQIFGRAPEAAAHTYLGRLA